MFAKKTLIFNSIIFLIVIAAVFAAGFWLVKTTIPSSAAENEEDKEPPVITDVRIATSTATSTEITWKTDEMADSMVNFGLDKRYGIERDPRADKTEHRILLEDLLPATNYFLRITSSDVNGNQGISSDFSFVTGGNQEPKGDMLKVLEKGLGGLKEKILAEGSQGLSETGVDEVMKIVEEFITARSTEEGYASKGSETTQKDGEAGYPEKVDNQEMTMERVVKYIQQIEDVEELEEVQEAVRKRAEEIMKPPTIILDYANVEFGTDYAIITWSTDKESNSIVSLATEDAYNEGATNPYTWSEGDSNEKVLDHRVEITGLRPATTYHFQVSSKSELDLTGRSTDKTFRTKAVAPEIYGAHMSKIEETAATVMWTTNVPCSSIIEYTNLNTGEKKLEGNSSYLTVNSIRLNNLVFDTYYSVVIRVESEDGEKTVSPPLTFITIKDEVAPVISKVNTESTLYPGADSKVQTIINWWTDEASRCQLFYHQGLIASDKPFEIPLEDVYNVKHIEVVTNFIPSSVYKYWITCQDDAGNKVKSDDFTMLTPSQEESIIDIIIKNFEQQFSWLKKK